MRQGLTNEQIAGQLDVSLATAKFHVGEIMGKLGVESRHDAATWPGRPRRALGFAPLLALTYRLKVPAATRLATIAVIACALFALAALATRVGIMHARSEGGAPDLPDPTPVLEAVTETT
jgi:hypothetical protein